MGGGVLVFSLLLTPSVCVIYSTVTEDKRDDLYSPVLWLRDMEFINVHRIVCSIRVQDQ